MVLFGGYFSFPVVRFLSGFQRLCQIRLGDDDDEPDDSATFVQGMLTSAGSLNPPMSRKLIWGGLQSSIAAVLLLSGGLVGLQTASIIAALYVTAWKSPAAATIDGKPPLPLTARITTRLFSRRSANCPLHGVSDHHQLIKVLSERADNRYVKRALLDPIRFLRFCSDCFRVAPVWPTIVRLLESMNRAPEIDSDRLL